MPYTNLDGIIRYYGTEYKINQDELAQKANQDGYYEEMSVGSAKQLLSNITIEDTAPYLYRTSGGSTEIGDRESDKIVGVSLPWNQLVQNANFDNSDNWVVQKGTLSVSNNEATVTLTAIDTAQGGQLKTTNFKMYGSHVYFRSVDIFTSKAVTKLFTINGGGRVTCVAEANKWDTLATIGKASADETVNLRFGIEVTGASVGDTFKARRPYLVDLTLLFGSTIADYIVALETANAGAGVAYFKKLFPNLDAEYQYIVDDEIQTAKLRDYTTGQLISVRGLRSHDMTGFNQWDEEWESGGINDTTGEKYAVASQYRSVNYIHCVPNTSYYIGYSGTDNASIYVYFYDSNKAFIGRAYVTAYNVKNEVITTPSNCKYMLFKVQRTNGTTYQNDICISLDWDGSRRGEYESFVKHSYALDNSLELRGILKISNGDLYADGDTYESDGTVNRKYGIIDLGTVNWSYDNSTYSYAFFSSGNITGRLKGSTNFMCSKYVNTLGARTTLTSDKTIATFNSVNSDGVAVRDDSYNDATAFKTAMSGVYLIYEKETPTTETAEPYTNPQIVDDFGTEEYVTDSAVPVGHVTQYMPNLVAKLEMAPNSPDGAGDYLVRQTGGTNEYVSLASNATIQDIIARLEALEGNNG